MEFVVIGDIAATVVEEGFKLLRIWNQFWLQYLLIISPPIDAATRGATAQFTVLLIPPPCCCLASFVGDFEAIHGPFEALFWLDFDV